MNTDEWDVKGRATSCPRRRASSDCELDRDRLDPAFAGVTSKPGFHLSIRLLQRGRVGRQFDCTADEAGLVICIT